MKVWMSIPSGVRVEVVPDVWMEQALGRAIGVQIVIDDYSRPIPATDPEDVPRAFAPSGPHFYPPHPTCVRVHDPVTELSRYECGPVCPESAPSVQLPDSLPDGL